MALVTVHHPRLPITRTIDQSVLDQWTAVGWVVEALPDNYEDHAPLQAVRTSAGITYRARFDNGEERQVDFDQRFALKTEAVQLAADAVAASSTVLDAATAAVDREMAGRNVVEGGIVVEDEIAFSVVDKDGKRTWIEADMEGHPTPHSVELMSPGLAPAVGDQLGFSDQNPDITGISFAVVDENGLRTEIEVGEDGRFTERVVTSLRDRMGVTDLGQPAQYRTPEGDVRRITSGPDIVCWGDSMTAGAGGGGRGYTVVLQELLGTGRAVQSRGVGGESSITITMRSGATPLQAIPVGGSIPADTSKVEITLRPIPGTDGRVPAPLKQGSANWANGTFAGVTGTITRTTAADGTTDVYWFNRAAAGSAVAVTRPTPFLSFDAEARRGDLAIIWIGQNGPSHARAKADVAAIVGHLNTLNKRFLVISRPTSTDVEDAEWHDLYGRRFVPIRKYLVEYGLADAGITPTAQDETDMAAGRVPTSLRVDSVHFNAAGYEILAKQLFNRLKELRWA